MSDALDRAVEAASEYTDGDADEAQMRRMVVAVLRVMADDIRALHTPVEVPFADKPGASYTGCIVCFGNMPIEWPCPTVRILDAYVGPTQTTLI